VFLDPWLFERDTQAGDSGGIFVFFFASRRRSLTSCLLRRFAYSRETLVVYMAVPVDPAAADLEVLANPAPPPAPVPALADPAPPALPAPLHN